MSREAWNMSEPSARSTTERIVIATMISISPTPFSLPRRSGDTDDPDLTGLGEANQLGVTVVSHSERGRGTRHPGRKNLQRRRRAAERAERIVRVGAHVPGAKRQARIGPVPDQVRLCRGVDDQHYRL